jgi:hypothetical protein
VTATPPAPRGGAPSGLPLVLLAFLLSPIIVLAWAAGCALLRVTGWPRWRIGAAAVVGGAIVVWAHGGPVPAIVGHFSGILALGQQLGRPMLHLPPLGSWPRP